MIGWTVFIGVILAAIFLGPPLFWDEAFFALGAVLIIVYFLSVPMCELGRSLEIPTRTRTVHASPLRRRFFVLVY